MHEGQFVSSEAKNKSDFLLRSILANAFNRSNNRDCFLRANIFPIYHVIQDRISYIELKIHRDVSKIKTVKKSGFDCMGRLSLLQIKIILYCISLIFIVKALNP